MRRISLKSLMLCVSLIAFGLAALRNANEIWAGVILMVTLGTLGTAMLGVICRRGTQRFGWIGFFVFDGGYLLLVYGPWFSSAIQPYMGTTKLFEYAHDSVVTPTTAYIYLGGQAEDIDIHNYILGRIKDIKSGEHQRDNELANLESDLIIVKDRLIENGSELTKGMELSPRWQATKRLKSVLPGAQNREDFCRVAHCIFAFLAGLIGAVISSRMYRAPGPRLRARGEPVQVPDAVDR